MSNICQSSTNVWDIITAIGTVGAVIVALLISLTQGFQNWCKARRIRHAIAPALIGDLRTVENILNTIGETASELLRKQITDARHASVILNLGRSLIMPSFDRFKDALPDLGASVAPVVIETYGKIIRIFTLTETYPVSVTSVESATDVINSLHSGSVQLIDEIKKTIELLGSIN